MVTHSKFHRDKWCCWCERLIRETQQTQASPSCHTAEDVNTFISHGFESVGAGESPGLHVHGMRVSVCVCEVRRAAGVWVALGTLSCFQEPPSATGLPLPRTPRAFLAHIVTIVGVYTTDVHLYLEVSSLAPVSTRKLKLITHRIYISGLCSKKRSSKSPRKRLQESLAPWASASGTHGPRGWGGQVGLWWAGGSWREEEEEEEQKTCPAWTPVSTPWTAWSSSPTSPSPPPPTPTPPHCPHWNLNPGSSLRPSYRLTSARTCVTKGGKA